MEEETDLMEEETDLVRMDLMIIDLTKTGLALRVSLQVRL
jgi:hypothetical protein